MGEITFAIGIAPKKKGSIMPSRKGKGRQSLAFGSKLAKAQFQLEWQGKAQEEYDRRRQQQQRQRKRKAATTTSHNKAGSSVGENARPRLQLRSLQRALEERQFYDQMEDRAAMFVIPQPPRSMTNTTTQRRCSSATVTTTHPGWLVFLRNRSVEISEAIMEEQQQQQQQQLIDNHMESHHVLVDSDSFAKEFRGRQTLQALCLASLATALPQYLEAWGLETLHFYLSLLPAAALTSLSVLVSQSKTGMTKELLHVIGSHTHVTRLSVFVRSNATTTTTADDANAAHSVDDNYDSIGISSLIPTFFAERTSVPESWEDNTDDDDCIMEDSWTTQHQTTEDYPMDLEATTNRFCSTTSCELFAWKGCIRLERLELGNCIDLSYDLLKELLEKTTSSLTHLGLSGSLTWERGPDILWGLPHWSPNLQYLDLSGNPTWVTENLLRGLLQAYNNPKTSSSSTQQQSSVITIKATGCDLPRSTQLVLQMEFGTSALLL